MRNYIGYSFLTAECNSTTNIVVVENKGFIDLKLKSIF